MKPPKSKYTIIPKIVAGRKTREVWLLTKLLLWFAWTVGVFAFVQCELCEHNHPKKTARECLLPRMAKR